MLEQDASLNHGYDINNYLNLNTHFDVTHDLIDLVEAAHNFRKASLPFLVKILPQLGW